MFVVHWWFVITFGTSTVFRRRLLMENGNINWRQRRGEKIAASQKCCNFCSLSLSSDPHLWIALSPTHHRHFKLSVTQNGSGVIRAAGRKRSWWRQGEGAGAGLGCLSLSSLQFPTWNLLQEYISVYFSRAAHFSDGYRAGERDDCGSLRRATSGKWAFIMKVCVWRRPVRCVKGKCGAAEDSGGAGWRGFILFFLAPHRLPSRPQTLSMMWLQRPAEGFYF